MPLVDSSFRCLYEAIVRPTFPWIFLHASAVPVRVPVLAADADISVPGGHGGVLAADAGISAPGAGPAGGADTFVPGTVQGVPVSTAGVL